RLHAALSRPARRGFLQRLFGGGRDDAPTPGLYLWGGVGRGKTFLIDLFNDGLPQQELRGDALAGIALPRDATAEERAPQGPRNGGDAGATPPAAGGPPPPPPAPRLGRKRRTHFHRFMRTVHAQ